MSITLPSFNDGDKDILSKYNSMISALEAKFGSIANADIAAAANISGSKIADNTITSAKFSAYSIDSSNVAPTESEVALGGAYTLTQDFEDTAMTFTINPSVASRVRVDGSFVFASIQTDAGPCKVRLVQYNGTEPFQKGGVFSVRAPADDSTMRITIPGIWLVDVEAGSHTFTIQAEKTNPGDGNEKLRAESRIIYRVYAQ